MTATQTIDRQTLQEILDTTKLSEERRGEVLALQQDLKQELRTAPKVEVMQDERYTLVSIMTELLPRLEAVRKSYVDAGFDGSSTRERLRETMTDYVSILRNQFFRDQDRPGAQKYWEGIRTLLDGDFIEAYLRIANRKSKLEDSDRYKYFIGNRVAVTVVSALPGLLTLRLPYSTPLVMGGLAVLGYKVLHPFVQRQVNQDLQRLAEFTVHQQPRITTDAFGQRNQEKDFTVPAIMGELIPRLETARLAQKSEHYGPIVKQHLTDLKTEFEQAQVFNNDYWAHLEVFMRDEFLPRFTSYATAQNRVEERGWLYRVFSNKWAGAVAANIILSPLYLITARVAPFGVIDDALMLGLFGAVGYHLPKMINPGHEDVGRLYRELSSKQATVLSLAGLKPAPVLPSGKGIKD